MKIPDAEALKALLRLVHKTQEPSDEIDRKVAEAFDMPGLRVTHSLSDGVALFKAAVPNWTSYNIEGTSDRFYEDTGEFDPEWYEIQLTGPTYTHRVESGERHHPVAELCLISTLLSYVLQAPALDQAAEREKARVAEARASAESAKAEEPAATPEPEPAPEKEYPPGHVGYVESWADWLARMRDMVPDDLYLPDDGGVTLRNIMGHYNTCIGIMMGQARAIEIVQAMLEEMYASNPTPRMKALKTAIEAVYAA